MFIGAAGRISVVAVMLASAVMQTQQISAGVHVWSKLGLEAGRVSALVLDPTNSNTVYAATNGGIYKSTDGGSTWNDASQGLTDLRVVALVANPQTSGTLYAATAGGVFKTTNGAVSWSGVNSGLPNNFPYSITITLAIDPRNPNTLYAGQSDVRTGRIFKSVNEGASWIEIAVGSVEGSWVLALVPHPETPDILYALTDFAIFKSSNGGTNWTRISSELTLANTLILDPNHPDTLYAATERGVFKSTNGGTIWDWANPGLSQYAVRALAIHPGDSQTVYAGTDRGVFKTANGGISWNAASAGLTTPVVLAFAIDSRNPDILWTGTTAGVFKSANRGTSWVRSSSGLAAADVNVLVVDSQNPAMVYAGTTGGVLRSANAGLSWVAANAGLAQFDVVGLAIDPRNPKTLFAGAISTGYDLQSGVFKSLDGGTTWSQVQAIVPHLQGRNRLIRGLTLDRGNPDTIFVTTIASVIRSTDGGMTWTDLGAGQSLDSTTVVLGFAVDPQNSNTLYVSVYLGSFGGIWKSTDAGATWSPASSGLPSVMVRNLVIDPQNPGTIYASWTETGTTPAQDRGRIFRTVNGGTNWVAADLGVSLPPVNTLALDPQNPRVIYAGTERGVYRSTNYGTTWSAVDSGRTMQSVAALVVESRRVLAGTNGGGLYEIQAGTELQTSLPAGGSRTIETGGTTASTHVGYAVLESAFGISVVRSIAGSNVRSEAAIPAATIGTVFSAYIELGERTSTGLALVNTTLSPASITFETVGNSSRIKKEAPDGFEPSHKGFADRTRTHVRSAFQG